MIIVYSFASFVGAALTALVLWQTGPMVALMAMPFGGSLFAAGAAALVVLRSEHSTARQHLPDGIVWC